MKRPFVRGTSRNPNIYDKLIINEHKNANILLTDDEGIVKHDVATSTSLRNPFSIRSGTPVLHVSDSSNTGSMSAGNLHLSQNPVAWFKPYQYTVPDDKVLVVTKAPSALACFDTSGWGGPVPPQTPWITSYPGGHWGRVSRVDSMLAVIDSGKRVIFDPSGYHGCTEPGENVNLAQRGGSLGNGYDKLCFSGMLYDKGENPEITPVTCTKHYYDVPDAKTLVITSSGGDASGYVTGKRQWQLPDLSGVMFTIDDTNNALSGTYNGTPFSGNVPPGEYSLWGQINKGPTASGTIGHPISIDASGLVGAMNDIIDDNTKPLRAGWRRADAGSTPPVPYYTDSTLELTPPSSTPDDPSPAYKWWYDKTGKIALRNYTVNDVTFDAGSTANSLLDYIGFDMSTNPLVVTNAANNDANNLLSFPYISDPSGLFWSPSYVIRRPCGGLTKKTTMGTTGSWIKDQESRDHPGQTLVDQNVRVEFGGVGHKNCGFTGYTVSNKYMNQIGLGYDHPQQVSVYYEPT
mgnify:CR=1 FL=1